MPGSDAVALAVLVFLAKLAGGTIAVRRPGNVPALSVLTGGVLLAAVLLQLLPEAMQRANAVHLPVLAPVAAAILAVALLASVDGMVGQPRRGSRSARNWPARGIAGASGFVGHGWLEGASIGIGLQLGTMAGLLAALAVAAHHLCEGLALVCYLFQRDRSPRRVVCWLLLAALAPVAGALAGSMAQVPDRVLPLALGLFSGLFAFAAVSVVRHQANLVRRGRP
jgi:zinc transporter, ZIP family